MRISCKESQLYKSNRNQNETCKSCNECVHGGLRDDFGILLNVCRMCDNVDCYNCINNSNTTEAQKVSEALKAYYNAKYVSMTFSIENELPCNITVYDEHDIICVTSSSTTFSGALSTILEDWGKR